MFAGFSAFMLSKMGISFICILSGHIDFYLINLCLSGHTANALATLLHGSESE